MRRSRRTMSWLLGIGMGLGMLGGPAAAGAPSTWYVAPEGSGGGSCTTPDFTRIQDAIDAAGRRDTIRVCPGRYRESLQIFEESKNGLTIVATVPGTAIVRLPKEAVSWVGLYISGARWVHVRGLTLQASRATGCIAPTHMVYAGGADAVIRDLRISGAKSHCQADVAIEGSADNVWIGYNQIRQWRLTAIRGGSRVVRNSVRVRGAADAITSAGLIRGNHVTVTGSVPGTDFTAGIQVYAGGRAVANRVANANIGIFVQPVQGDFVIRDNLILDSTGDGIQLLRTAHGEVTGNVVLRSGGTDCVESDPLQASDWSGNIGATSAPSGLCTPPTP